jgi:hypothetical protein
MVNLTIFVINLLKLVHKQDFAIILPNGKNGTEHFKNLNNVLNTEIYSFLETSGGQSYI